MTDFPDICVAVLAAGYSRRFGDRDKLTAIYREKMLGLHIADTLQPFHFRKSAVITAKADHPCVSGWQKAGFDILINQNAQHGMGSSVALAAQMALQAKASALLICLADMPLIPRSHIERLHATLDASTTGIAATSGLRAPCPPAIFEEQHCYALTQLDGDQGARSLLKHAATVPLDPQLLIDIDRPGDLEDTAN